MLADFDRSRDFHLLLSERKGLRFEGNDQLAQLSFEGARCGENQLARHQKTSGEVNFLFLLIDCKKTTNAIMGERKEVVWIDFNAIVFPCLLGNNL